MEGSQGDCPIYRIHQYRQPEGLFLPPILGWLPCDCFGQAVLEEWKETGACHHGSGERYVRKHWYRVKMTTGEEMKIYFERQARSKRRWWLYTVASPG